MNNGSPAATVSLPPDQFAAAFPFHLALRHNLELFQVGHSLSRIAPDITPGIPLSQCFSLILPKEGRLDYAWILANHTRFVLLEHRAGALRLRGAFVPLPGDDTLLFLASPWLTEADQLESLGLGLDDFAVHDPMTDLLMLLQFNKMALEDSNALAAKLKAREMALIDTNGHLELRNAAAKLLTGAVDSTTFPEPLLAMLCCHLGWQAAVWWQVEGDTLGLQHITGSPDAALQRFLGASAASVIAIDSGMTGRAWSTRAPVWSHNLQRDLDPRRARFATQAGLITGVAFPLFRLDRVHAVVELFISTQQQEDGRLATTLADISARIKEVLDRLAVQERLREAEKLKAIGQLTGGLAHDFNNLLGIILGNLDLLEDDLPREGRQRKRLDTARIAALRGAEVTRALLAVARRQPMEVGEYDINALVIEMLPLVRSSAGAAVSVASQLAPGQLLARLDAAGLRNVVLNLVINARDAMASVPGPKVLTLHTRAAQIDEGLQETLAPGGYAVLEVSDTGAGMSEHVLAQAFEPFFTTKERGRGVGLGLAMVYGYARQLEGTASIESRMGAGTTVRLYLPLTRPVAVGSPPPLTASEDTSEISRTPLSAAAQERPTPSDKAWRVLVVDDEPDLCELACSWLQSLGCPVTGVHSPAAALECLQTGDFEVLLTDIVMPGGIDGIALAREALRRQPELHVLFATGDVSSVLEEKDLPGIVIYKPYRGAELARAMRDIA